MNKKQLIAIWMILGMYLAGCTPYKFVKIEEGKGLNPGYHVLRRNVFIDEFVIDENNNHPQDLLSSGLKFRTEIISRRFT